MSRYIKPRTFRTFFLSDSHQQTLHELLALSRKHKTDVAFSSAFRHNSDFDFGLGSFSLLEEITKGQEWAKFINPNLYTSSINQRPPEETQPKVPPNPFSANQSAGSVNQLRDGSSPWTFRSTEPPPAQTAPVFSSVSMEVSDGKQQESAYRPADPVELMEHGHNQSDGQLRESRPGPQLGPSATPQVRRSLQTPTEASVSIWGKKLFLCLFAGFRYSSQRRAEGQRSDQQEEAASVGRKRSELWNRCATSVLS